MTPSFPTFSVTVSKKTTIRLLLNVLLSSKSIVKQPTLIVHYVFDKFKDLDPHYF